MNRKAFFAVVRAKLGRLKQPQVEGFDLVLNEYEKRGNVLLAHMAYMLATAWWETGRTMQPVKEAYYLGSKAEAWRKKNLRYWPYYGRGLVQLTWESNYRLAGRKFNVDFLKFPDRVMEPRYAIPILFTGMEQGWFTTKSLDDYIDDIDESDAEDLREFIAARKIINGTDKAKTIGRLALVFEEALKAGGANVPLPRPLPPHQPRQPSPLAPPAASWFTRLWQAILEFFKGART